MQYRKCAEDGAERLINFVLSYDFEMTFQPSQKQTSILRNPDLRGVRGLHAS